MLSKAEIAVFGARMAAWRRLYGISVERAGELMGCLPQNILFIERGTIDGMRAQARLEQFELVEANMVLRRCAIRRVRLKRAAA